MEPHYYHKLLFFSLVTVNSANAICVPINSTKSIHFPSPSHPIPPDVPSPEHISLPISTSKPPSKSVLPILPSLLEAVPQSTHADPAIKKICDSTDYPQICISQITPLLNGKADLISVVEMAIKATTEHTRLAISAATKISSAKIPSKMVSIHGDCQDSYNDALDNFEKAMNALSSRDVGTMNSMLSAAITDFSDCDDELSGMGSSSPLLDFNAKLAKMTSNCLAVVSLIK